MKSLKKWNKESIYSTIALLLSAFSEFGLYGIFDKVDLSSEMLSKFDTSMYWLSGSNWRYPVLDLLYWIPTILALIFLVSSLYFGIKAIKKTSNGEEKGRMIAIISTTIASFILIVSILLIIFPL